MIDDSLKFRTFEMRWKMEHENKKNDHTALAVHSKTFNHDFKIENSTILARENNTKRRKIREVIEILKCEHNINFKRGSDSLCNSYRPIILKCKI